MRHPGPFLTAIAAFSFHLLSGTAAAEMYKWTDKNGAVHITDYPPAGGGKPMNLEAIRINRVESHAPGPPATEGARGGENARPSPDSGAASRNRDYPKVEVYGTSWCPACRHARNYFRSAGIPFDDYDVEKDKDAHARMKRLGGGSGVPAIVIGGKVIRGFSKEWCERALGIR